MPKHLLYVSDLVPREGPGGQIVIDRHLRRLAAEGWSVTIVSHLPVPAGPWGAHQLPGRRWWWPPFRPEQAWLARARSLVWARALPRLPCPDVILTLPDSPIAWFAAHLAGAFARPLVTIVHDHWREYGGRREAAIARHVCAHSQLLLAVSEEMLAVLAQEFPRPQMAVMPPLPSVRRQPFAVWRDEHGRAPVVAHVGALHAYHEPFLRQLAATLVPLGGRLLLLCPPDNPTLHRLRTTATNLWHQATFPHNHEALDFIHRQATALVVMYPFGRRPDGSGPTGFPSRLIDFAQLGLPVIIAAPAGNPVRTWAGRHDWPLQLDPADATALASVVGAVSQAAGWATAAGATRQVAEHTFNPDIIHGRFVALLDALCPRP